MNPSDDRKKFTTVVAPYLADAHAFARWLTHNRADAEDVVQEACIRAFRALPRFSGPNAHAWLLTIVRNTAFTLLKEKKAAALVGLDELSETDRFSVERGNEGDAAGSPEAALIAAADAAKLEAFIAALPAEFREVLVLRDIQGLEYREIAGITGSPIGTVMSRLARAPPQADCTNEAGELLVPLSDDNDLHLIHAYLDGELDVMAALAVERKIAADPDLRKLADEIATLKKVLAEKCPPEPLPPQLRSRIEAAFALETTRRMPNWAKIAASILAVAALSSTLTGIALRRIAPQEIVVVELFDAHLRSLMAEQPTDVASSDQHTVKPWFNGRITQSPRVVDLAAQGFELVGGRVDVVGRTPLSTLVYRRREHVISLTEITGRDQLDVPFDWRAENGFNMIRWSNRERSYVAISDLNVNELETFAKVFRGSTS